MKERIEELRGILRLYEKSYEAGMPEVSDQEYDERLQELEQLEAKTPDAVDPTSPSVSLDKTDGKLDHEYPMLSLPKAHKWSDVIKFDNTVRKAVGDHKYFTYILQPKLDGVAASLVYKDRVLVRAITRGDGQQGEDITEHIKNIKNVPQTINSRVAGDFIIRGEVVISKKNFDKLEGDHSNPRNTVAGTLKAHDVTLVRTRNLDFIAHSIGDLLNANTLLDTVEFLTMYSHWGFEVVDSKIVNDIKHLQSLTAEAFSANNDNKYMCDGLVVKVNDYNLYRHLPDTAKHHKYGIALKPKPSSGKSIVKDIFISKGEKGRMTPVALVEPLVLENVTIQKVNLYNSDNIKKLGIKVGSKVEIVRSGGVIPKIVRVINEKQ